MSLQPYDVRCPTCGNDNSLVDKAIKGALKLASDRDEWKDQHENLLSVRQSDLKVIEQLRQRVAELEAAAGNVHALCNRQELGIIELDAENARLKASWQHKAIEDMTEQLDQLALYEAENSGLRAAGFENGQDLFTSYQGLQKQLATSQLEAKRLRWAIDKWCKFDSLNMDLTEWQGFCAWYQSLPIDDSALREYVAGKMKPMVDALEKATEFIHSIGNELLNRRCTDWYPEGANNAANSMSEDMRLLGNNCVDFTAEGYEALEAARKELS